MSRTTHSPTVRRRRLGMRLRRMREELGLSLGEAAERAGISRAGLGKIETADTKRVPANHVDALVRVYDVPADQAAALHELARDAGERGWWWRYRHVFGPDSLPDFEAEASQLLTYEVATVPGLLQTPEYAEGVFRGGPLTDPEHIRRQVAARMERQQILHRHDHPCHLWAIIDEAALRRPIGGPEVMRAQLEYLERIGQHPNIDIQVLPFEVGAHPALGIPFTILEFPDPFDPTIVYTDAIGSGVFEEDTGEIARCTSIFRHLQATAPNTVVSAQIIAGIREESTS